MIFILVLLILSIGSIYYLLKPHSPKSYNLKKIKPVAASPQKTSAQNSQAPIPIYQVTESMVVPQTLLNFHLINKEECKQNTVEEILAITQSIPRPHCMLKALTREIENSEKLYELVKSDPEIAAKVLQTVNSAGFYLTQKITRLNHAILYLGTNLVKNIALQCVITTPAQPTNKLLAQAFKKIWDSAFLASSLAFIFGKNLGLANAADVATHALLAYIGNLAIIAYKPELASRLSQTSSLFERVQIEQQELGVHSALVGSELALSWELPQEIVEGIGHNLIPLGLPASQCALPIDNLRNVVVCYFCCRTAELIIEQKLEDIAELNLLNPERVEFVYLPDYLRISNLQDLLSFPHRPDCRNEINKLLQKIDFS